MSRALDRLGYVQGPPGTWHHAHYLDGWPVVYQRGSQWCSDAGRFDDALDAVEYATEDERQRAVCRALRMRRAQDNP